MRLIYAERTVNRNVSFEYLNRQLVWHAFTVRPVSLRDLAQDAEPSPIQEFLVFLLPLLRPRRILRRIMRMQLHLSALALLQRIVPRQVSTRLEQMLTPRSTSKTGADEKAASEYARLPRSICALCFQRQQVREGPSSDLLRVGLPSSDPLDPSSGALAPSSEVPAATAIPAADEDSTVTIPHAAVPCGCIYCYHCLASMLLSEEGAEDIVDEGGWRCLRCATPVTGLSRA